MGLPGGSQVELGWAEGDTGINGVMNALYGREFRYPINDTGGGANFIAKICNPYR